MKRKIVTSILFYLISSCAWCVCQVPQPRMICAEYFHSDAVVIAKLVATVSVPKDAPDYFIYKLSVVRALRGHTSQVLEIYEGNDSGRATFDWNLNEKYLLFLDKGTPFTNHDWTIDGCGNSGPLEKAHFVLQKIQRISNTKNGGMISGMVGTDSWTTGVPGIAIKISGDHQSFNLKTNVNGRFSQKVPAGTYRVTATKDGIEIPFEPFSYENPKHVVIDPGGCAQVQFTDAKK